LSLYYGNISFVNNVVNGKENGQLFSKRVLEGVSWPSGPVGKTILDLRK